MILEATHTHLYPGYRGRVAGLATLADIGKERACLVEFADGSACTGRVTRAQNGWRLQCGDYRTRAGTAIGDKRWAIDFRERGDRIEFRITGRQ